MKNSPIGPKPALFSFTIVLLLLFTSCSQSTDNLKTLRNSWSTYIYLSATQYKFSKLGGIDEFDIPVRNNSDYLIDQLRIKVQYIKAAGGVFKSEVVTVDNLAPHSTKTVRAPKSSRGTSVELDIIEAYSREMKMCYPRGGGDILDPYYCK